MVRRALDQSRGAGPFHDLISVSRQILKDRLGDVDALIGRNPFIVEVWAAIAFGVLDEGRVNRIRSKNCDRLI
jgi:hypothetical protein